MAGSVSSKNAPRSVSGTKILGVLFVDFSFLFFSPRADSRKSVCGVVIPDWHNNVLALRSWKLLKHVLFTIRTFQRVQGYI